MRNYLVRERKTGMRRKGVLRSTLVLLILGLFAGCGERGPEEELPKVPGLTQEIQEEKATEPTQEVHTEKVPQVTHTEGDESVTDVSAEKEGPAEQESLEGTAEDGKDEGDTVVYGELPLLLIETEQGRKITDDEVYTNCTVSVTNCEADYEFAGAAAGIRIRGNSTQMYEKKPYRIKFEEKQQVLGLSEGAHKSWVLLAEFNDPSLLRNLITYRFANALSGISYATDCALVEVYLNGEYEGVYLLAEQTQVDETGVADPSVTDTGYLLELEADLSRRNEEGKEGEAWFAVTGYASEKDNSMQLLMERTFDASAAYYVVKSDARSAEQMAYIREYMIQVYDAVYKEKTEAAVAELVDLASAVDMYLVQLIANDYDNNYSSMYLYKNAGGKLMFGAPWDFDLAYGNFTRHTAAEDTVYVYHLLRQLGEYDWFRERAAKRFAELSEGENSPITRMKEDITTFTEQYAEEFDREYARWRENLVGAGGFGDFGDWGSWGDFKMPEGAEGFGAFGDWGSWGDFKMPEGAEGFGAVGDWGSWGDFKMPEGAEGFGAFGEWGSWGDFELPEGAVAFGGFGNMGNFSYGAVYDTHEEAAEALLDWLEARLTWVECFLTEAV